ncbi:MAG: Uma2 family endonuclease [Pseudomonadota bacterium]
MEDGFISYHTRPDGERYFTNADMARMVEQGLIDPEDRWELIRGAWFDMGSEGFEHMDLRTALVQEIILQLGRQGEFRVGSEGSIFFSHDTELRPDLIVYRADVGTNEMTGSDISLVIEVMKTSQRRDRDRKVPVYAGAGVPEVWLIDLDAETIDILRTPDTSNEVYTNASTAAFTSELSPASFQNVAIRISDLIAR